MYRAILDHCQPCPRTVSCSLGDRCTTSVLRWLSTSAVKHLCLCLWTTTKTTQSGLFAMHWYPVWVWCTVKDRRGKPADQQVSCHVNLQMHKDTTVSLSKRRSRYLRCYSSGKTSWLDIVSMLSPITKRLSSSRRRIGCRVNKLAGWSICLDSILIFDILKVS